MKKVPVEASFVLMVEDEQREAFDKVLFDHGVLQVKTLNGSIHNVEVADFDIMDGEDYIFEVNEKARPSLDLRGEVNDLDSLAI